jgi:hypothetical protein
VTSSALIEQAVFTSARSRGRDGYHLVATSPGVTPPDARELAVWGPTHDSLTECCPASGSINYHPLASGAYCVSRTVAAGSEYSNRGGLRVYTQSLLVPPAVMGRFAFDPFRVMEAANASGFLEVLDVVPERLEPTRLLGRASPVDALLLERLCSDLGPRTLASLLQSLLSTPFMCIRGGPVAEQLMAGLLCLVPPPCRAELSLSTGLRISPRRPFRLISLEADSGLARRLAQRPDTVVFDLSSGNSPPAEQASPWGGLIVEILRINDWDRLAQWYTQIDERTRTKDLDQIALDLRQAGSMSQSLRTPQSPERTSGRQTTARPARSTAAMPQPTPSQVIAAEVATEQGRRNAETSASLSRGAAPQKPAWDLAQHALMDKLEELDGAVLDAIHEVHGSLERVKSIWPELASDLAPNLVDESRQQYVRFAVQGWLSSVLDDQTQTSNRSIAAMQVLAILFSAP